jgi:hypothetical protein
MKILIFFIIIITGILLIYAFQADKTDQTEDTLIFSELTIEGQMGKEKISQDSTCSTIIFWFHPECEHCRYQLDVINNNLDKLQGIRLLFITEDKSFFSKKYSIKWPDLVGSSKVLFGIIEKSRFTNEFGPVITPSLLFFNHQGILKERLIGEVKIQKIVQLINKHPVPEQMMSGSN